MTIFHILLGCWDAMGGSFITGYSHTSLVINCLPSTIGAKAGEGGCSILGDPQLKKPGTRAT